MSILAEIHEALELAEANPFHGRSGSFQASKRTGIYSLKGTRKVVVGGKPGGKAPNCGRENRQTRCWDRKDKPWSDWPSKQPGAR